jgi:hypothetical protein
VNPSDATRLRRALLAVLAVLGLVAVVVVVAGSHRPGGGSGGTVEPSTYVVETVLTLLMAVYAAAAVATIWIFLSLQSDRVRRQREQGRGLRRSVPGLLLALALLALLVFSTEHLRGRLHLHRLQPARAQRSPPGKNARLQAQRERRTEQPKFRVVPFLLALGAIGGAAAAMGAAERRRRRRLPREPQVGLALADVLDETLDDLRAERDPRRAVIAAYARMERVLAAHGLPRRPFEAPVEYLSRVLPELASGASVRRLTDLFERARFSTHAIDVEMRDAAIDAVETLQEELRRVEEARAA